MARSTLLGSVITVGLLSSVAVQAQTEGGEAPAPAGEPAKEGKKEPAPKPAGKPGEGAVPEGTEEGIPPAEGQNEGETVPGVELSEDGGAVEFAQSMEQLLLNNYPESARLAYISLNKTKPSAEKYESAQFVLAEALAGAGLNQAAAEYYFAVVEQRQNPALLPRALSGLARLARERAIDEDKLIRGVLVEADLANVPPDVANFLSYYRGLANLRLGQRRWAISDFKAITGDSFYAQQARLVRVVTHVKDNLPDKALAEIEELLKQKLEPEILLQLTLIRARLWFEGGKTKEAIEEYQKVRKTKDAAEGELLLERSWAHFQGADYHDAMGLLYALAAPSSRELFLPEQYVVRGMIYQRFCHFRAAKAAVRDFRTRYGGPVAALKSGVPPEQVSVVKTAAEILPEVFGAVRVLGAVRAEKIWVEDNPNAVADGGLAAHLTKLYGVLETRGQRVYDRALRAGSRWIAERILEADEQASLLDYEVGVSIFKPIAPQSGEVKLRPPAEVVPISGEKVYYPFDGEYWSDELKDMRFLIQDRCVE